MIRVWPIGEADTNYVPCQREDRVMGLTSGSAKPMIKVCYLLAKLIYKV